MADIYGTTGNDTLTSDGDTIGDSYFGLEGDDSITGSVSGDVLDGGDGNDRLKLEGKSLLTPITGVTLLGGEGNDFITVGGVVYDASLNGGSGNDWLDNHGLGGTIEGGDGDDRIDGRGLLLGDSGNDTIYTGDGTVEGGDGRDLIYIDSQAPAAVDAGNDDDLIVYVPENDPFAAPATVYGGLGNDTLQFLWIDSSEVTIQNDGDDYTVQFRDRVIPVSGVETLVFADRTVVPDGSLFYVNEGSEDDDTLTGGYDHDRIDGKGGDDLLVGGTGDTTILGGDGNDELYDYAGSNVLLGEAGDDSIGLDGYYNPGPGHAGGGDGNDTIEAHDLVASVLDGGAGNDLIHHQRGRDTFVTVTLLGGNGDDTLSGDGDMSGGAGNDSIQVDGYTVSGGDGDDVIEVLSGYGYFVDAGADNDLVIFSGSYTAEESTVVAGLGDDTVRLSGDSGSVGIERTGSDAFTIGFDNGSTLTLSGVEYLAFDDQTVALVEAGIVTGTEGGDSLNGGAGAEIINGLGGDDTLDGGEGNDTLDGGEGNDTLADYSGTNSVSGGAGSDTIYGGDDATLLGGDDNDEIWMWGERVSVDGGAGDDTISYQSVFGGGPTTLNISGGDGNDILTGPGNLSGGAGDDTLITSEGSVMGDEGNDSFIILAWASASQVTVSGGDGDDTVTFDGTSINGAFILGGEGTDAVRFSGDSTDYIITQTGLDEFVVSYYGDEATVSGIEALVFDDQTVPIGSNIIEGTEEADTLTGGAANDSVYGYGGDDSLDGGEGGDTVEGGDGNDTIMDFWGTDSLSGGAGNDHIEGVGTLMGGGGDDDIWFLGHGNVVDGGIGNDTITYLSPIGYDPGPQTLSGGDGDDSIRSQSDMSGGAGNDVLTLEASGTAYGDGGNDAIAVNTPFGPGRAEGGDGNDTISGWHPDNVLNGGAGDDSISGAGLIDGGADDDVISVDITGSSAFGGDGDDSINGALATGNSLNGGAGDDTLVGGDDATLTGGDGNDSILAIGDAALPDSGIGVEADGGAGNDTLSVETYYTATVDGGDGSDSLTGGMHDDSLLGGSRWDTLSGGDGNDTLDGGLDNDRMTGGKGNDLYSVDHIGDRVLENAGEGNDTVISSISWAMVANIEGLVLSGTADLTATGNGIHNAITGNAGNNVVTGGTGHDTINGGDGDDSLDGGLDSDVLDGGAGNDTVLGGQRWDTLSGGDGDDLLDGGTENDRMSGGAGNDTYYVDHVGDRVLENANEGTDRVYASIDFALWADVEHLTLAGTAVSGTGNGLGNRITGNANANVLSGGHGNDTLAGGLGNDSLWGGAGMDSLSGGGGRDDFVFAAAAGNGSDRISDFVHGFDRLVFSGADYGFSAGHALTAAEFTAGSAAVGLMAQFVWDAGVDHLWWDGDGAGAGAAVDLALIIDAVITRDDLVFV